MKLVPLPHKFSSITLFVLICSLMVGCAAPSEWGGNGFISAPVEQEPKEPKGVNVRELLSKTFSSLPFGNKNNTAEQNDLASTAFPSSVASQATNTVQPMGVSSGPYSRDFDRFGPGPNMHLWRASLEVLSFMPMALADPVTGLIQTHWHQSPGNNSERIRVEVYVLSSQLREDALRVNVYRQIANNQMGQWVNATTNPSTARQLENRILERANQRRISLGQ